MVDEISRNSELIPLSRLNIDESYQRDIDWARVREIAENWDPRRQDPLQVSKRKDGPNRGKLFVVNGQHRFLGARERFGLIGSISGVIHEMTRAEEAKLFAEQDKLKKRVGAPAKFGANLIAGDEDSRHIKQIVEEVGFELGLKGKATNNTITAISTITNIYKVWGSETLEKTLMVLYLAWGPTYPETTDNRIIAGMAHFLYHFPVVDLDDVIYKLQRAEAHPRLILQKSAVYGSAKSGSTHAGGPVSRAILDQINHRRSTNRLEWDLKKYRTAKTQTAA